MMRSAAVPASTRRHSRATLGTCGAAHFLHDGFSDTLYVLFPLWAQAFGLSLTQVGILKMVYSGALASFQLPAGFLAERFGGRSVLALGTAITGLGFIALAFADGLYGFILCLLIAGMGSATQHPLSSAMVATAYAAGTRRAALGTYNFTGDLGKVVWPALIALGAATIGWQASVVSYGTLGMLSAFVIFLVLRHLGAGSVRKAKAVTTNSAGSAVRGWGIRQRRGFQILSVIGVIDAATRTAFLTFLPFLLITKGAKVEAVGGALALVFAGGAAGKALCGLAAARFGIIRTAVITELATGGGILLILTLPLVPALISLPIIGFALNGTSSVLYGTVAEFTAPESQSRAFGLFYTIGIAAGAIAPLVCGVISDLAGVSVTLMIVGLVALTTVPLCPLLAASLAAAQEKWA